MVTRVRRKVCAPSFCALKVLNPIWPRDRRTINDCHANECQAMRHVAVAP